MAVTIRPSTLCTARGSAGGCTPLMLATEQGCTAAVQDLLAAGADPRRQNDQGDTAITLARQTYEQLQREAEFYATQSRKR